MSEYPIPENLKDEYKRLVAVGEMTGWGTNSYTSVDEKRLLIERIAKLEAVLLGAGFIKSADEESWVPPVNAVATKLYREKFALEDAAQCGKPAKMLSPFSWFVCVLPPNHDGECRMGGNCFVHGAYIGEQCPLWPACTEKQMEGMKFAVDSKVGKLEAENAELSKAIGLNRKGVDAVMAAVQNAQRLEAENASLREQLRVMQEPVSDQE